MAVPHGEVVDEVDARAELLAAVVQAFLALLVVRDRRHGHVVAAGVDRGDQRVEAARGELEVDAELLAERGRDVGVDAHDLAALDGLHRGVLGVGADLDDTRLLDVGRELREEGALSEPLDDSEELLPPSVWSPQAVSSKAPATARDPTAARRVRAAVVRRVELAVMVDSSGGWMEMPMGRQMPMSRRQHTPSGVATSCDDGILPFGLRHSGGQPCQNRITGDPRTASLRYITTGRSRTICGNPPFRPKDLRLISGCGRPARAPFADPSPCQGFAAAWRDFAHESCHSR